MDQDLIDKLKSLTGQDDANVTSMLSNASIDQMYDLIDAARKNDSAALQKAIAPLRGTTNNGAAAPQDTDQTHPQSQPQNTATQSTNTASSSQTSGGDDTTDGPTGQQAEQPSNSSSDTNKTHPSSQTMTDKINASSSDQAEDMEEAMKDKHKAPIKVEVPKPKDVAAKELATNPLFRPKKTPSRKETVARKEGKHKGRMFDAYDPQGDGPLSESVLGMSIMPAIKKMLSLAGRPVNEEEIQKAMEDFMGDFNDPRELSINDIKEPVGTTIPAGPLDSALAAMAGDLDAELDAMPQMGELSNIQCIRDAFQSIESNLPEIKVSEFAEVRSMLADLMSRLDRLANNITGK